jgi:hypothetical protein
MPEFFFKRLKRFVFRYFRLGMGPDDYLPAGVCQRREQFFAVPDQ